MYYFKKFFKHILRKLFPKYFRNDNNLNIFLKEFFEINKYADIIQIGLKDGVTDDPLRSYLPSHKGNVILVEALKYYCEKVYKLYSNQSNITICNALVSSNEAEKKFFYIDPQVADEMDGTGPFNNWAHGQGSLSKDTIIKWIYKNKFRGPKYIKNIDKYINAIVETVIKSTTIDFLCRTYQIKKIDLLVIDVQGAEYQVLKNLKSMDIKPKYIIYEDDFSLPREERKLLEKLLKNQGYIFVLGNSDKLWMKN